MDTAHWPQEFCPVKGMEELVPSPGGSGGGGGVGIEQQPKRPGKEQAALQCPRCSSANTKFCYYNNYSLTQPRYFCKACRRYWTAGGSLRNVPVGGGSRKNRRPTSSAPTPGTIPSPPKPTSAQVGLQDLGLAFPMLPEPGPSADISAMVTGRGLGSFMPMHPMPVPALPEYSTLEFVAVHRDYRPDGLNFPLDGISGGYGSVQEANGRLRFPFEDISSSTTTTTSNDHRGQGGDAPGFWSGMRGGGGGAGGVGGGSW